MVRQILAALVAASMLMLAACGENSTNGDEPQPTVADDEQAVTIAELLATEPEGDVVVWALLFDDGSGLVLCGALAESFPPQCPGERVPVANPEAVGVELTAANGVRWSDQHQSGRPLVVTSGEVAGTTAHDLWLYRSRRCRCLMKTNEPGFRI